PLLFAALVATPAYAAAPHATTADSSPEIIRTALLLTTLSVLPALFISMTSFVRIAVVLAMVRHAFGMPETPPNAVLVSLAMLLTALVMAPTFGAINAQALQPLLDGDISVQTAVTRGSAPLKTFMLAQVRRDDIATIYEISRTPLPSTAEGVDIIKL